MNLLIVLYKKCKIFYFNRQNNTNIRSLYASLNAHYGRKVMIDVDTTIASNVTIGDYSYVNCSSRLQNCEIGKFCSISSNVNINPYKHNLTGLTTHPIGDCAIRQKRVLIGNDVLISLNVVIMEGVHIGDGAVIGAGAVVTHDVGPYEIWGGVPAHFIRFRVKDERVRKKLTKFKWWDLDDTKREQLINQYRTSLDGINNE